MSSSDYGNWWNITSSDTAYTSLPITLTSSTPISAIGTAPIYINVPSGLSTAMTYPYVYAEPNQETLNAQIVDTLFEKMVTTIKPGERIVVCMDKDVTSTQMREVAEGLAAHGLDGIVISGARAGTGFEGHAQKLTQEEQRVDILARIGELWDRCPHLKLTTLLEWWGGEEMEDADFAKAVEIYFQKVTNGIYRQS